jgi:hemerythrin-like domain-containing protein
VKVKVADMEYPSEAQPPTTVLKSEHSTILRVIDVLQRLVDRAERGDGFEAAGLARCVEFFRFFADACHHAKEEDLLFPLLETRGIPREGGPIGVMLYEHSLARKFTQQMADALDAPQAENQFHAAAHQYMELLRNHIFKEDNVLFQMADRVLSDDDQSTLCGRFCEVGCRGFGGKQREELIRLADELERQWPA